MFLFSCSMVKLNCFVKKKDDNGKYHMRTVIALVSYVIIAISPSSRSFFSSPPSRSIRLVIAHASRLCVSYLISFSLLPQPRFRSYALAVVICHNTNSSYIDTITPWARTRPRECE